MLIFMGEDHFKIQIAKFSDIQKAMSPKAQDLTCLSFVTDKS